MAESANRSENARANDAESERYLNYADADADWFWEIDPNFRFTLVSKRFEGRSAFEEKDLIGLTPWQFADADPITDPAWAGLLATLNRREAFRQFRICIRNDDAPVFWRMSARPVVSSDGRFLGYRGVATDETIDALKQNNLEMLLSDYRSILDGVGEGVACFDARSRLMFVNAGFWKLIKVSPHRVRTGMSDEAFFAVISAAIENIDGHHPNFSPSRLRGSGVWHTTHGGVVRAETRSIPSFGYALTIHQGDASRVSPPQLEQAGSFSRVIKGSPQGFFIHVEGKIVFANYAVAEMFGCPYHEFIGSEIFEFILPAEVPRLKEFANSRLKGRYVPEKYQFTGRRRDGVPLRVEFLVSTGQWEGKSAFHVFAQDRSAEAQALRALSESERRFRHLVEGSIQGYFIHSDWEIIYANSAAASVFGYEPEEFLGLDVRDLIAPEERELVDEIRARRIAGDIDVPERYEVGGVRKDGSAIVFEVFSKVIDWDGVPAIQSTILDVTHRKNVEAHLLYAKETAERADRAKTEFLGNMSHEFRTPLNAIIGFSQMIHDQMMGETLPQYVEYANAINSSGVHLLDVVNDILDVASIESGALTITDETFDVAEICRACERMLRHRAHKAEIAILLDLPERPIMLLGDARRLKQILINLLGNAIKFSDAGGSVTVSTRINEAGCITLSVSDTGIGISEDHLANVFSPFFRVDTHYVSQREGTGLGLPLVKALADLHDASININSEVDIGTTVCVTFPAERTVSEPH